MKFKALEALRGLAAISVVLYHSNFVIRQKNLLFSNSAIFVDFFFILSGFIIAFAYLENIQSGLRFKTFALLRFGRLYPLHLFMLGVWLPYILLKGYAYHVLDMHGVKDPFVNNNISSFISNLLLINSLGVNSSLSWNYPAWSISVEFFTYIVFFGFMKTLNGSFKGSYALAISIVAYGILYMKSGHSMLRTFDLGMVRCVGGFFLGVFIFSVNKALRFDISKNVSSTIEVLVVGIMFFLVLNSNQSKALQLLTFVLFGFVVLVFSLSEKGILSRVLGTKFMVLLGTLSYSIYMVHAIIIGMVGNVWQYVLKMHTSVLANQGDHAIKLFVTPYAPLLNTGLVAVVIGVSFLTYTYIEKPWRDKFRKLAKQ